MKKTNSLKVYLLTMLFICMCLVGFSQSDTSLVGEGNAVGVTILEIIFKAIGFTSPLAGGIILAIMAIVRLIEKRYVKSKNAKVVASNTSLNIQQAHEILK